MGEDRAAGAPTEGRLGRALASAKVGYWNLDLRADTAERSPLVDAMYGFAPGEVGPGVAPLRARHHPEDQERGRLAYAHALAAGERHIAHDYRVLLPDGRERWLSLHGEIVCGADGTPERVVGILMDVTERRLTEAALAESRERLELAVSSTDLGIWDWNLVTGAMIWSERAKEIYGFPPGEPVAFDRIRDATHPEDLKVTQAIRARALDPAIRSRETYEYRILRSDGQLRWIVAAGQAVFATVGGETRAVRYVGTIIDVTARKALESSLRDAVRHERVLQQELNHRVKNNLQVVATLLRLQADRLGDASGRRHILAAHERVMAIARAHASLTQAGDPGRVDLGSYLRGLCADLAESLGADASRIEMSVETRGDAIDTDLDRAVPIGLIVNELVTNAARHAFPAGTGGRVRVELDRDGAFIRLAVADDGVGLAASDPDMPRSPGSGLGGVLVRHLSRQISATMRTEGGEGTRVVLVFPAEQPSRS